ncbi:peptide chain release factor 1 [Gonapodya prolifera JEL478]|uniref:Peptide chain release factor 1 n=1 Tax=Gonapodya prolifera (strain JEL478) TaxID=1344416 RepID=A0A139AIK7_GONPJ|nr:peptide chain release factor 1 [Gonapodya prolifera JEL478]|eukprot:KXS16539.1 peptide chain release factor 1 [Gonapodya prolifera JEL478]
MFGSTVGNSNIRQLWTKAVEKRVDVMVSEYDGQLKQLNPNAESESLSSEELTSINKRLSSLEHVATLWKDLHSYRKDLDDLLISELLSDSDASLRKLAEEDARAIETRISEKEQEIMRALIPKDEADSGGVILEIRAGTGGDEAALFVTNILRMYERYAVLQGWRFEVLSTSPGDKGLKEALASVSGTEAFRWLKGEAGVHRVQRVPETETAGRVHTSTVTVAVLSEPEEVSISIPTSSLRIETMRASGAGGQSVNTTDSAVRITHLPTGLSVYIADERSQHKNRSKAMRILQARLLDMERTKADEERRSARKSMVGGGGRSEKVRTYNWQRSRVVDHRVGVEVDLTRCLDGEGLEGITDALVKWDEERRLNEVLNI